MQANEVSFPWSEIQESVDLIKSSYDSHDEQTVLNLLVEKVSGYKNPKKTK
jgi:hypothetical protein